MHGLTFLPRPRTFVSTAIAILFFSLTAKVAHAADGTWNTNAAGNWSDTARWLGGTIADGVDATANFNAIDITANRTVTINTTSRTLGTINFADIAAEGSPATFKSYTIAASGGATLTLATSAGTPTINVSGTHIINAQILGNQGFIKNGGDSSNLQLGGSNLFTGAIQVNGGTLRANHINAFNNQAITTANGAQIYHNAVGNFGSTYNIQGDGVLEGDGATRLGAIRFANNGAAGITLSGTVTLDGDAGISARGLTTTGATITGQITGNYGVRFGRTSTTTSAGNGILILANTANNWTGNTTIEDGILKTAASGVIPSGVGKGNVIMKNGGTAVNAAIADTVLDLNGFNQTINGLSHASGSDLTKLKIRSSGGPATLTVGGNNASGNYGGILENGTGTLGLTKIDGGVQILSGPNTYTGNTAVNGGTLLVNGSLANTPVSINSGGKLGGVGSIGGNVTLQSGGKFAPGDAAAIGTLTLNANLDLSAGVNAANSQSLLFRLGAAGSGDQALLTLGSLNIGSGVLEWDDFLFTDLGVTAGDYTLIDTTTGIIGTLGGNVSGIFGELTATLDFADGGNDLVLHVTPIPEPSVAGLFGFSIVILFGWSRLKRSR